MLAWIAPLADATPQTVEAVTSTYRMARLQALGEQRWQIAVLLVLAAAIVAFVWWLYRRDSVELRPVVRWLLMGLRIAAFVAVLLFFLGLEKRTERQIVYNSRILLLIDTSQSMAIHDFDSSPVPATPSRIDQLVAELADGTLLDDLRKVHDVVVVRFNRNSNRVASLSKRATPVESAAPVATGTQTPEPQVTASQDVDWQEVLLPRGDQTRLGTALKQLIEQNQATPVSAIIVVSDGGQNAGVEPAVAVDLASKANIPIYTVGLGSDRRPVNVRIGDVTAPSRAFPGDAFTITGYVQSEGLGGRTVTVEMASRESSDQAAEVIEASERVTLGPDGELVPVKFELSCEKPGRRTYRVRVIPPREDRVVSDNAQDIDVDVIDHKTRVLLLASAATREYRFLRNQLRRDSAVEVDVLLQSARPGISQDANQILDEFPHTKEDLYQYDAIIAFDADWERLNSTQIDLLEQWVGEEAGGLILVAGPIHTPSWTHSTSLSKLRNLCPVEFFQRLMLATDSQYGSKVPVPVEFTQEGTEAEFLWLGDTSPDSQAAWASLPGIYGYHAVKRAKPGATVYAHCAGVQSGLSDDRPVYFAGQFYGGGRVFYVGSGEMWRLRSLDDAYFEQFYTKLLRYVSQGRLLRGSSHGTLLVERDRYQLGETVVTRALLSDAQHEPLQVPSVSLQVLRPDTTTQSVQLKADASRAGLYTGQFTVLQDGGYQLVLPVPETIEQQLTRRIQVRALQDLERRNPQRNDALLSEIAGGTGGQYYVGLDAALGHQGVPPLVGRLKNRSETMILAGAPDRKFEERFMKGLLALFCATLCLEWLVRRLCKLA